MSSGTVIAQIIPMLATLVLSRIYTPNEMGEWGVFSSYASVLAVIGCLRYDNAIVKPLRITDSYNLAFASIFIALFFTLLLYLIVAFIDVFDLTGGLSLHKTTMYILPLYVFCLLLIQVLGNLANKNKRYRAWAISSIGRSFTQATSRIVLGYSSFTSIGLVLGAGLGTLFSVSFLSVNIRVKYFFLHAFSFKKICYLLQQYRDFPKYDLLSNLLNSVSSNIPVIILSYFFLEDVVGYFSMALSLLFIPMSIIGTSLGQLYYRNACELYGKKEPLNELTKKIFIPTYIGCGVFMLILMWVGEFIFAFLLGSEWAKVGRYVTYMSLWLLMVTSISPISCIFYVMNKQKVNVCFNIVGLFIRISALLIGGYYVHSSDWSIILFGIVGFIFFVVQGMYIKKITNIVFSNHILIYLFALTVVLLISYIWKVLLWLN